MAIRLNFTDPLLSAFELSRDPPDICLFLPVQLTSILPCMESEDVPGCPG
jgi:hypothetical protein